MAEVSVVKQTKQEPAKSPWTPFEVPFFRGSLFGVNPFALMRQFTEDMDKFFVQTPRAVSNGAEWTPAVEVKVKDGKLLVTAEIPGVKNEDVKVSIDGDTLIVEGERKQEKEEKREGFYHSERSYGKFYRSIPLPDGAKADQTTAQFNNGVLEVSVPVAESKNTPKQITVQDGSKKAA